MAGITTIERARATGLMNLDDLEIDDGGEAENATKTIRHALGQLEEALVSFGGLSDKVRADTELSATGKARRIEKLAEDTGAVIDRIEKLTAKARERAEEFRDRIARARAVVTEKSADREFLKRQEVRQALRELSSVDRTKFMLRAVSERDELIAGAVLEEPLASIAPLFQPSLIDHYRDRWARGSDEQLFESSRILGEALRAMDGGLRAARMRLELETEMSTLGAGRESRRPVGLVQ